MEYDKGLVLSGGGARCIAHLGMIAALRELGLTFDIVSGTSGGAIVGAFLAAGYEEKEVVKIAMESKLTQYFRPAFSWKGFIRLDKVKEVFARYLPEKFEDLESPLIISTTNFSKGEPDYFSSGPLYDILIASSSIPLLFEPVEINGDQHVDGGVVNNFPVLALKDRCRHLTGMHCNPIDNSFTADQANPKTIVERSFLMAINVNSSHMIDYLDLYLEPPALKPYKVFDIKKGEEIYNIGYDYVKANEKSLHQKITHVM